MSPACVSVRQRAPALFAVSIIRSGRYLMNRGNNTIGASEWRLPKLRTCCNAGRQALARSAGKHFLLNKGSAAVGEKMGDFAASAASLNTIN